MQPWPLTTKAALSVSVCGGCFADFLSSFAESADLIARGHIGGLPYLRMFSHDRTSAGVSRCG